MYEDRQYTVVDTVCVCDRCGLEMHRRGSDFEWQERVSIAFRAGYDSVFGDGNLVELDLCQHCLRDLMGPWLRVRRDDPCEPKLRLSHEHHRAYQDYQLRQQVASRARFQQMIRDLQTDVAD